MRTTNPLSPLSPSTTLIPYHKLHLTELTGRRIVPPDPIRFLKQRDELPPLKRFDDRPPLLRTLVPLREIQDDRCGVVSRCGGGPDLVGPVIERFLGEDVQARLEACAELGFVESVVRVHGDFEVERGISDFPVVDLVRGAVAARRDGRVDGGGVVGIKRPVFGVLVGEV